MSAPAQQAPSEVVMVRPHLFRPNPLTIADNAFQSREPVAAPDVVAKAAYDEVTDLAQQLRDVGVRVHLFDDFGDQLPDSVFPNNWFSTHPDGRIALYPMYSPNRRGERRSDIVEALRRMFKVSVINDYSVLEDDEVYLEGTGAMVLDHTHRTAYVARSYRAHDVAVGQVCRDLDYETVMFATRDARGVPIYHTNVMMSVGTDLALVCLEAIPAPDERRAVVDRLRSTGRTIVELTLAQIDEFAGNAIEVQGTDGRHLVLSARAHGTLTAEQLAVISQFCQPLAVAVPTVELAGGSVRCMITGIHLPPAGRRSAVAADDEQSSITAVQ